MSESHLRFELDDAGVAILSLHRPEKRNAFSGLMGRELGDAYRRCDADDAVRAIVLTGAGSAFCAGADLGGGASTFEAPEDEHFSAAAVDPPAFALRKPVIAAINGPAAGMAIPIACACDLRFASDRAVFTVAFSKRGLIAEWGSAWLLPRLVGPAHALDLLWSSRKVEAEEACRIGLVNRVLPHDELLPFVRRYVEQLAAECSPTSLAVMKRQVWQQLTRTLGPSEKEAIQLMLESFDRPDFREGVMSFLEKRPPKFQRI